MDRHAAKPECAPKDEIYSYGANGIVRTASATALKLAAACALLARMADVHVCLGGFGHLHDLNCSVKDGGSLDPNIDESTSSMRSRYVCSGL